jgi:hypothetical protein
MKPALRRRLELAIVVLALFPIVTGASGTSNPQSRCLSGKLAAIGKKEAGLLSCLAKMAAKGRATTFGACIQKAARKFAAAFAKAGSCDADRTICECLAENCAITVRVSLPDAGPSKCEAARLRAAGKRAIGKVRCSVKAATEGLTVDQACIQNVEARYQAAFAKTSGCTGEQTTVEVIVDEQCVGAVGADPTGGGTVSDLCTGHACDGVDARGR